MKELNKHFRTQTTALNLFLQSVLIIALGVILIYDYDWFFRRVSLVVFGYFCFLMGMNFIQLTQNIENGIKDIIQGLFPFFAFGLAIAIYYSNLNRIIRLIPPLIIFGTLVITISSTISFVQYHKEKNTAPFRYLLSALTHLGFGVFFTIYTYGYAHPHTGIRLIALYVILLGVTMFVNGLAIIIPNRYILKVTEFFSVTPPAILMAFKPIAVLNRLDDYFSVRTDETQLLTIRKSDIKDNVQVYVHVAQSARGIAGHVDIAIDDTIYCYGTYDRESVHLGGIIGTGVLYEVKDKKTYLDFCQEVRKETVIEYGLAFTEQELEKIHEKMEELKSRTVIWKCRVQREGLEDQEIVESEEMSCKIAKSMEVIFYKFKMGTYKYYWMFVSNCVSFTDELLKASGMKTIAARIITPGTYFTFLNDEFAKGNSKMVSRTVYYTAKK